MSKTASDSDLPPYHRYVEQLDLPLWEKTCLFEGGVGKNLNGNMFALLRVLQATPSFASYEPVLSVVESLLSTARKRLSSYGLENVRLVASESDGYNECLARAKYLFSDNTFPAYFTKRPDQVYANTWHGTPLKRLGLSDIANSLRTFANVQKNLLTADYLLFPNEYTRDAFMDDYSLAPFFAGKSVLGDYPRNDVFSDPHIYTRVRETEGISTDQQVIAYMPTWRGAGRTADEEGQIADATRLLTELDQLLHDDQALYVNLHFAVQGKLDFSEFSHIRPFPAQYETYDFLAACDLLVTDYSSVMFDYAVTGRPIVLFAYDEDTYMTEKGTYFPYRSLPFPIAATTNELVRLLEDKSDTAAYEAFRQKFCTYHTGHAAHDVLTLALLGEEGGSLQKTSHSPGPIEDALYVFSLGKKRVREAVLPTILEQAEASGGTTALITTASYSEGAIQALTQLRGRLPILMVVRRHVQTAEEVRLFDQVSQHRLAALLRESKLKKYFEREAGQIFCHIAFSRICAIAPDGSYPMWMLKGTQAHLIAQMKDASVVGKKALHAAQLCVARGYELSDV